MGALLEEEGDSGVSSYKDPNPIGSEPQRYDHM